MPDAQELDVILTQWTRTPDGRWWAECEAILPARYEHADGRTRLTGAPTPISVLADDITPIPGEDYSAVPTDGAIAGRQWTVEKLRDYTEDAPAARLHRRDCWQARDSHQRITTEDAVDRLARRAIAVCDICRPDRALRRLCRATLGSAPAASPVGGGRFTPRRCRHPRVPLRHLSDLLRGLRSCSEHRPANTAGRRHVSPRTAPDAGRPSSPSLPARTGYRRPPPR
ncbi:DUF6233 domain-containing protein [Streptomyces sp. ME19-01-6]|uniref:DUF6233 domain-containing protein n=1 Tax=Streptomyces sp. ME19-01-6 TaxID=3028686 RepID=UPI0029A9BC85|nr:DUF6233 domain-containing protein [Streptomyces sp. ME19-01-6]MDX3230659.1 DUF6233 domain-containing protein [Streptomyces sp. ME19-01-6]